MKWRGQMKWRGPHSTKTKEAERLLALQVYRWLVEAQKACPGSSPGSWFAL